MRSTTHLPSENGARFVSFRFVQIVSCCIVSLHVACVGNSESFPLWGLVNVVLNYVTSLAKRLDHGTTLSAHVMYDDFNQRTHLC